MVLVHSNEHEILLPQVASLISKGWLLLVGMHGFESERTAFSEYREEKLSVSLEWASVKMTSFRVSW